MAGSLNTPDVLTQPIAENGDKNTIPATNDQSLGQMSQSTGFPEICSERIADGGKAPRRADFNGAFNMLSRYIFFKQNGGIETFRADVSTAIGGYPKDAILGYRTSTAFKLVRSLIANNTYNFNTTPSYIDDGTHWESVIPMSKNIANWSNNVTNCITEIPQDIKLELNNGTLTLKAGSKVYVPNGFEQDGTTPHFDTVIIENDMNTAYSNVGVLMLFWSSSFNYIFGYDISYCKSGSSVPASFTGWFYNTTTNTINDYQSGTIIPNRTVSLPLGLITTDSSSIKSIDQIFNGLGYIGSTVFALPGVKGMAPNGRNADGTLNNQLITVSSVLTSFNYATSENRSIILTNTPILQNDSRYFYNAEENKIYWTADGKAYIRVILGSINVNSSSQITSMTLKTPFHAVDYNDFQKTAEQTNTLETSKANTSLDNVSAGIDFVVESQLPTALNDYTWYRKYKSGWVEQGGYIASDNNSYPSKGVTLPVPMNDANYQVQKTISQGAEINIGADYVADKSSSAPANTTTTVYLSVPSTYYGFGIYWEVKGKAQG